MPIFVWIIGGLVAWRVGDSAGEEVGKLVNVALIGGAVFVAVKLARAR